MCHLLTPAVTIQCEPSVGLYHKPFIKGVVPKPHQAAPHHMKLSEHEVRVGTCGHLPQSERDVVGKWLHQRLEHYHGSISKHRLPGQAAIAQLMRKGLSELKRRYQNTATSAPAVAWAWLGQECMMGNLQANVVRPMQGGKSQSEWAWSAMLAGGWITANDKNMELHRQERIISILPRCAGTSLSSTEGNIWYFGDYTLTNLHQMLRRYYPKGTLGVDLMAVDIAILACRGHITGDCLRCKRGGSLDMDWWARVKAAIATSAIALSVSSVDSLEPYIKHWYSKPADPELSRQPESNTYWVLDLCCGFRSLDLPVHSVLTESIGANQTYLCIGVDICTRQVRGSEFVVPDLCADLLDDDIFPTNHIVRSICERFNLSMSRLVHVHASPPCITNSRADASNRKRGCGYRDWHSTHCLPLAASTERPIASGLTSPAHHQLAVTHDRLEKKLLASLIHESHLHLFSFTVENPVGEQMHCTSVADILLQEPLPEKHMCNNTWPLGGCCELQLIIVIMHPVMN